MKPRCLYLIHIFILDRCYCIADHWLDVSIYHYTPNMQMCEQVCVQVHTLVTLRLMFSSRCSCPLMKNGCWNSVSSLSGFTKPPCSMCTTLRKPSVQKSIHKTTDLTDEAQSLTTSKDKSWSGISPSGWWYSHMLSCLMKLAMLLCLKNFGRTSFENRPWSNTWKLAPLWNIDNKTTSRPPDRTWTWIRTSLIQFRLQLQKLRTAVLNWHREAGDWHLRRLNWLCFDNVFISDLLLACYLC